ncbi:MAG: hypothetical protein ABFS17_12690, partial [Chloroflexota bacterium]
VGVIVVQMLGILLFQFNLVLFIFILIYIAMDIGFYFLENKPSSENKLNSLRIISLITNFVVSGVMFAPWAKIGFNPALATISNFISEYLIFFAGLENLSWGMLSKIVLGALLATGEANLIIRYVFQAFNLAPKSKNNTTDVAEYNAGRVIGILERILIFYLVLNAEFGAIGFILAAKSFTRFKDLEERSFAEYVLIGTLLSTITAIFIAGFTSWLL